MKKFLSLFALIPVLAFAQEKGFVIKGNINGLADGKIQIAAIAEQPTVIASDTIKNGAFTVKGSVPEPGLYYLVLSNEQPQYIFIENTSIKITGAQSDIKKIQIEGSQSHADFLEFRKVFDPLLGEINGYAALWQKETNEKKKEEILKKYDSVVAKVNDEVGKFIDARKTSPVSPFLLFQAKDLLTDVLTTEKRFNMLSEENRNSSIGKTLQQYIAFAKVGAVGTDALDFIQNDVDGKPVSFSSFKGKYVLLDFWASWCKPCREENPNVVKVYNKFKDKNFTVLGVSLDQSKEAWVKAINLDKLTWHHVSDLQQWNNAVAQMYHINSIPGNFLIDPDGKIIGKDLRGQDLEKKLCEILGGCN